MMLMIMKVIIVVMFIVVLTTGKELLLKNGDFKQLNIYRLPTNVIPINYVIELSPYFVAESIKQPMTFDGNVQITLRATEAVTSIVLHAQNLEIETTSAKLNEAIDTNTNIAIRNVTYDIETHKYTLNLMSPLKTTVDYLLTLFYLGHINNGTMKGFYRSTYEETGTIKLVGATQLEPTAARQVFPCFDEPGLKATFVLKINRLNSFDVSISNTKIDVTEPNVAPNRVRDIFKKTPIMSTYLLAFIISQLKGRENVAKTFGVFARPDAYSQTEYSFNYGQRSLIVLNTYLNNSYASVMEKMDMAALPDFSSGAMENWGLVTYREATLLYDPDVSTAYAQQRIATIVMHEQAHMWFGNLVTCDWWNHLWLNEGFATYFQYFGTAILEPTWNVDEQFNIEQLHTVFVIDSLESTHPMTYDVNSPVEISEMFDKISYNKGAAILRMMEHLMGKENFQQALNDYLKINTFKTATPERLYAALQMHTSEIFHIATIMNTWTTQSGYPVVTIDVSEDRTQLSITQKRFLLRDKNHNDQTKWEIPINYAEHHNNSNANFSSTNTFFELSRNQIEPETVELHSPVEWIIVNIQQTGYYRVNYDHITWTNIINALKIPGHTNIHVLNRAQIVDDMMNLARADLVDYDTAMSMFQYLEFEENYIPWKAALNNWEYIARRLKSSELPIAKRYMLKLIENIYQKLGFEEKPQDTRLDIYNRMNILSYACQYGHSECISRSKEEFAKFETTTYKVPVNIRPVVYCTAIAEGTKEEWEFLWKKYLSENVAAEQILILTALGCTKDSNIVKEYIQHILSDSIRLQDKLTAFTTIYNGHDENLPIVFDYVLSNYKNISDALGNMKSVSSIISGISSKLRTSEEINKLKKLYTDLQSEFGLSDSIAEAISEAEYNLKWANEHIPSIIKYMSQVASSSAILAVSTTLILICFFFSSLN